MTWTVADIPDQTGRTAVITGANSGIGLEAARALVDRGAHVVLACRSRDKGEAARAELGDSTELRLLDLADLASVRAFAAGFVADHDRLDLLVNNAGVMMTPASARTADGFELQFGTNHLGHFALTGLLLDRLTATPRSRVVVVSSYAHMIGRIDFDDLDGAKRYSKLGAYAQSKLANMLFGRELQRRLTEAGHGVLVAMAHPGWARTNLMDGLLGFATKYIAPSSAHGARPTLLAATGEAIEPAGYYGPRLLIAGPPERARTFKNAQDDAVARRLWAISQELTGVAFL